MKFQNETYYKNLLASKIEEFIEDITKDENELGWLSDNLTGYMTEAAWLIVKQNRDTNDFFRDQNLLKD